MQCLANTAQLNWGVLSVLSASIDLSRLRPTAEYVIKKVNFSELSLYFRNETPPPSASNVLVY